MATLNAQAPVGDFVTEQPARSRVFERLGIDYCCGGRMPLEQACAEKNLNVQEVLRELESLDAPAPGEPAIDWSQATMGELVDHIVSTHHAYLRQEMPRLAALADKVTDVHGEHHPELNELRTIVAALTTELNSHMFKEEQVLFPIIKQLEQAETLPQFHCGSVNNPIRAMVAEHDDAGVALARLRELTGEYTLPDDACNSYRALYDGLVQFERDMHQHIHKENNILFPRAGAAEARFSAT